MPYFLDLGDGGLLIRCRDAYQALLLAQVWVALETGKPSIEENPAARTGERLPPDFHRE